MQQQPTKSMNFQINKKQEENLMMSSGGFRGGTKLRISQQGFRPGSRGASQHQSYFDRNSINSQSQGQISMHLPLFNDELTFFSGVQFELENLQAEIDKLTQLKVNDNKSQFSKTHILQIRKWLASNSNPNYKEIYDNKMVTQLNPDQLVEQLNCKNTNDALVKLYRMVQIFEILLIKLTELESLQYLCYDQIFSDLCDLVELDSSKNQNFEKLNQQGIVLTKFTMMQINIERQQQLFQIVSKLNKKSMSQSFAPSFNERPQSVPPPREIKNEIQSNSRPVKSAEYYIQLIEDSAQQYNKQILNLQNELQKIRNELVEIKILNEGLCLKCTDLEEKCKLIEQVKEEIYETFQKSYTTKSEFSNSYEAALKLEFDCMKQSFEKKIKQLNSEIEKNRIASLREQNDLKMSLQREQETKKQLLNKLSVYIKL